MERKCNAGRKGRSPTAMFISEIPVRCMSSTGNGDNSIKWIRDLNGRTTARDIIIAVLPASDPSLFSLCVQTGRSRQILHDSARIYKVVASISQQQAGRRLLFEVRLRHRRRVQQPTEELATVPIAESMPCKKRVRFADEIVVQNIVQGRCLTSNEAPTHSNMLETISMPLEQRLVQLKRNFERHITRQQENYVKISSLQQPISSVKRSSLKIIHENVSQPISVQIATIKQISRSSSESGISSSLSNDDDLIVPTLETLV